MTQFAQTPQTTNPCEHFNRSSFPEASSHPIQVLV